jgi:hypothetical protein
MIKDKVGDYEGWCLWLEVYPRCIERRAREVEHGQQLTAKYSECFEQAMLLQFLSVTVGMSSSTVQTQKQMGKITSSGERGLSAGW